MRNIMTYLNCNLDEDGDIEPDTPIGNIILTGDTGRIEDDNLMLDTFLEALIVGFSEIRQNDEVNIDTIDEPIDLALRRKPQGIEVSYGDQVALIQDENVLHTELVISVKTILEKLDEAAKQQLTEPTNYSNLRYFLDHGIPKSVSLIE
jgi:hypothetical protein